MEELTQYLGELNFASISLRLFLATLFGGIIGMERELKKRPAGLRTFALVCIGSALAMVTNQYLCLISGEGDMARMAGQVISGVGFLGAGTIIVTGRQQVKGLTTAAGLWASASMGLALGAGFYEGAFLGFGFILFSVTVLHRLDERLSNNSKVIDIYMELCRDDSLSNILSFIHDNGYSISSYEKQKSKTIVEGDIAVLLELNLKRAEIHSNVIGKLSMMEGIHYVEELK